MGGNRRGPELDAEEQLSTTNAELSTLLEAAPVAVIEVDPELRVKRWNPAATAIFGWSAEEAVGRRLPYVRDDELELFHGFHARVLEGETVVDYETKRRRKDGTMADVSVAVARLTGPADEIVGSVGFFTDIGPRKEAERVLLATRKQYRTLVEQIPAITYIDEATTTGKPVYVSPQFETLLGISPEQWLETGGLDAWLEFVHPHDRELVRRSALRCGERGDPIDIEFRLQPPDGTTRWFRELATCLSEEGGSPAHIHGVMLDVTAHKLAEEALQSSLESLSRATQVRRDLLGALLQAEDEERRRISIDVHDDVVQQIAALRLNVDLMKTRVGDARIAAELEDLESAIGGIGESLRHLIFELRPPRLDQDSLGSALRLYLEESARTTDLRVALDDRLEREPSPDIKSVAFRIVQEGVANVVRHAKARHAVIELGNEDDGLVVRITDDGVGFDVSSHEPQPGHVGLIGMRERAEFAGGRCKVSSAPGQGTCVEFWLPDGVGSRPKETSLA